MNPSKLTKQQQERMDDFFTRVFYFSEEEQEAIEGWIPMTQKLFDSCIDRCMELGESTDRTSFCLLRQYPDFNKVYADRIEEEVKDTVIPEEYRMSTDEGWEDLCRRIREKYGEDAI